MNVYLVGMKIKEDDYKNKIKSLMPSFPVTINSINGYSVGLYGWTTKKKIIDEFLEIRNSNNLYNVKIIHEPDDDYMDMLKNDYIEFKLSEYIYTSVKNDKTENIKVVSTKFENVNVTMYGAENLYEYGLAKSCNTFPLIFNDKIVDALASLDYTKLYSIKYNCANPYPSKNNLNVSKMQENSTLNTLLFLYREMF